MYSYVNDLNRRTDLYGIIDAWNVLFTQDSIDQNLSKGKNIPRSGESVWDLIEESAKKGTLADGLELNITTYIYPSGREEYVTLNNRTLFIAEQANVPIKPNIVSPVKADNKLLDGKLSIG